MRSLGLVLCAAALVASTSAQLSVIYNHGVASGDPLPDAMIIWTRVTPRIDYKYDSMKDSEEVDSVWVASASDPMPMYNVTWLVSTQANMSKPETQGVFNTSVDRDYTVKVDVTGLQPRTQYYYQFECKGAKSPIGKFRTAPESGYDNKEIRYGQFTCSNWGWGYFNAYDYAAQLDLDFWMHAGDYIYEYGPDDYPSFEEAVRFAPFPGGLQPPHEITKLSDYREHLAHYRTDPGLQALHASAPLIAIWDDHEHTNDPWKDGAENHQPDEGDWDQRTEWSVRAWHEWMPVRGGEFGKEGYKGENITRSFNYGKLAKILALENRLTAKTMQYPEDAPIPDDMLADAVGTTPPDQWTAEQIDAIKAAKKQSDTIKNDPSREILGEEQITWVEEQASTGDYEWLLVLQTTNLHDLVMDYSAAVDLGKEVVPEVGQVWESALKNATTVNATALSYSTSPYLLWKYLEPQTVTAEDATEWSKSVASGEFDIITWFDAWGAYPAERERFMQALVPAGGNAIVHSGDTHAAFAAMLIQGDDNRYVGAEFSAPGVTSPDNERGSIVPLELHNAAMLAGKGVWMDTRFKGFEYVTVTPDAVRVNFVTVPWGSMDYEVGCDYMFEVPNANRVEAFSDGNESDASDYQPSAYGLPVATINELINVAGGNATRPPIVAQACDELPKAQPYKFDRLGVPISVGNQLASEITKMDVQ